MTITFGEFTTKLIRRKARSLIGKYGFTKSDQEDLEQEITLHVLERAAKLEREADCRRAYLTTLVEHCVANLIRHQCAQKRWHSGTISLNSNVRGPDGHWQELENLIDEEQRLVHRGCKTLCESEKAQLELEVDEIVERLPPALQEASERLMEGESLRNIAEDLGISRTTLRQALRQHFEAGGFSKNS
jgi:RNA polymerase sigma-70 factor (ECF subfamily)